MQRIVEEEEKDHQSINWGKHSTFWWCRTSILYDFSIKVFPFTLLFICILILSLLIISLSFHHSHSVEHTIQLRKVEMVHQILEAQSGNISYYASNSAKFYLRQSTLFCNLCIILDYFIYHACIGTLPQKMFIGAGRMASSGTGARPVPVSRS